jgi:hypothetical protein
MRDPLQYESAAICPEVGTATFNAEEESARLTNAE